MVCLYPSALLALCNAYCFDESDPQTHREFLEILLFWMHENYGNAESIYGREHQFNVPVPSASYQKEIYDWFISIKSIFDFSTMHRVTEWFYDVLDEGEIELAFNMLLVTDQKQFIKHYESMSDDDDAATVTAAEEIDLLNITNDSVVSYINQDEDLEVVYGYREREDTLEDDLTDGDMPPLVDCDDDTDTEFEVHTNVTVRNVNRTIDFDDFVNGLAEEVATERENNESQDYDSDIYDNMPELESNEDDYSTDDDSSDDSDEEQDIWSQEDWSSRSITV